MDAIKTVALDTNNTAKYYYFIEDHMKEKEIELIQALPQTDIQDDLEIGYSLSNCQGDGVCIRAGRITLTRTTEPEYTNPQVLLLIEEIKKEFSIEEVKQLEVSITFSHRGNYNNENSFDIDLSWNCLDENENYITSEDSAYDHYPLFIDTYRSICKELEKFGYELIEAEDQEEICRQAFIDFCELNHIETNDNVYDYDYTTDPTTDIDGMMQVATRGNTSLSGLWVRLPIIQEHTRDEQYRALA